MISRRNFVEGVLFTGCSLLTHRVNAQSRRREVTVAGRRVRTIDIHAHVVIPEATAMMGVKTAPTDSTVIGQGTVEQRFKTMDEWGTDMQALSINANWYGVDRDVADQVIRIQNEKLAEICAKNPDRFVALASVALEFHEMVAEQLEEGVKKYHL